MAFITEYVKTIKTYELNLTEEEALIIYKLLGQDSPGDTGRGRTTSFTLYEDFKEVLGELDV
jgi:hypothetical protein